MEIRQMGTSIKPAALVTQRGRKVELRKNFAETEAQLLEGEKLCAYATAPGGHVALVLMHAGDYFAVKGAPERLVDLYAIGPDVLVHAQ